jgi:hypothetical protein
MHILAELGPEKVGDGMAPLTVVVAKRIDPGNTARHRRLFAPPRDSRASHIPRSYSARPSDSHTNDRLATGTMSKRNTCVSS